MINKLIDLAFSGFWQFIGVAILLCITWGFTIDLIDSLRRIFRK